METEMNPMTTEMKSIENKDKNNLGVAIEIDLLLLFYLFLFYFLSCFLFKGEEM